MQQHAAAPAPVQARRPSARRPQPRWRLALLISVLTGFFLMHGLSDAGACISDALEHGVTQSAPVAASPGAVIGPTSTITPTRTAATAVDPCACAPMGPQCVPLRPQDSASLLLTLLLVALAALPRAASWAQFFAQALQGARAARFRPSGGAPVRILACVSRT